MDLRMTWEGREKKKKPKHLLLSVLSFLSSHSLPSNHLALIHDSSVSRCLWSLLSPFPSLLVVAFFHRFGVKSRSLSPVSAPHVLLKGAAGRVKEEERKGRRERERENSCDTGNTRGSVLRTELWGEMYNVQEGEWEFAVLSTPGTPKLVHNTFFESPTFVNWYWHTQLTHSFCHNCYHHCYLLTRGHVRLRLPTFLLYARVCICDPKHRRQ